MNQATAPRGWHRPVKPLALVLVAAGLLLVWLALFAASVWSFYRHWEARLTLREQGAALRLPAQLSAWAEVSQAVHSRIDVSPVLRLPIRQSVNATFPDSVEARVQLRATLPVDTTVQVDHVVPVHTQVHLRVPLHRWLPDIPVTLPLDMVLPVHLEVPVRAQVPVVLDVHASGRLPKAIQVQLDTQMTLRPRIRAELSGQVLGKTEFRLLAPTEPFDVIITHAPLRVPMNLLMLNQRQP